MGLSPTTNPFAVIDFWALNPKSNSDDGVQVRMGGNLGIGWPILSGPISQDPPPCFWPFEKARGIEIKKVDPGGLGPLGVVKYIWVGGDGRGFDRARVCSELTVMCQEPWKYPFSLSQQFHFRHFSYRNNQIGCKLITTIREWFKQEWHNHMREQSTTIKNAIFKEFLISWELFIR